MKRCFFYFFFKRNYKLTFQKVCAHILKSQFVVSLYSNYTRALILKMSVSATGYSKLLAGASWMAEYGVFFFLFVFVSWSFLLLGHEALNLLQARMGGRG
jgi:hypothetical protein